MSKSKRKDLGQPWFWLIIGGILATAAVVTLLSFSAISPGDLKTSSYTYTPRPATPAPVKSAAELLVECQIECDRREVDECWPGANMIVASCYAVMETMYPEPENPFDEDARIEDYKACRNLRDALDKGCADSHASCRRGCENVT